ncbi:MAG TPA: GNAT family N-acetyltransferase [Pseudonocardiaceae bacterium]|nr:GNAT family N-acetyltransferase [Pseudonocardiaceae bacterium]
MTAPLPAVLVRPRRPEDLPDCVSVIADTHRTSAYPVNWPKDPSGWLTPSGLLDAWVAEVDGRIVGHSVLGTGRERTVRLWSERTGLPPTAAGEIKRLCVASGARERSIGSLLLAATAKAAVERGLHPVLGVLESSVDAIALYERLGWTHVGSEDFVLADGRMSVMHVYGAP